MLHLGQRFYYWKYQHIRLLFPVITDLSCGKAIFRNCAGRSIKLNFAPRLIILTYTSIPSHHRKRLIAYSTPLYMSLRP